MLHNVAHKLHTSQVSLRVKHQSGWIQRRLMGRYVLLQAGVSVLLLVVRVVKYLHTPPVSLSYTDL